ncbi:MAG TPA: DUF4328 domain-containing protein [Pyrinomonadaceae bacterium]|jgi:hypothetical protein|nr:DUF4328 domain-containing protein [Pyrinomonadaceae bacterium]
MTNREYRSANTLSILAIAGVGMEGLLHVPAIVIAFMQIVDPDWSFGTKTQFSVWLMLQGLLSVLEFLALVVAAIFFLMWLYRAASNLASLRSDSTEFTPGWTVGWWFIPFANLVKPFQTVRHVWSESDPNVEVQHEFLSSVQASAPGFMVAWWALWILANIASNITSKIFDPENIRTTELSGYFFIVDGVLWIAAAALAITVIRSVTRRQEERHRRVGAILPQEPPPPPIFGDRPL